MSNQTNGLRFDVYERVHLPDDVLGIDELEEIELVPRIQVLQQGEQVLLKGHLLLSGVYRAQNERSDAQSLEHWIPVEITLPQNRINRLDDISVEIDNFDVDLLSARTLNITGVLSLLGIGIEPSPQPESWVEEEPFTVVHERPAQEAEAVASNDYYANWIASAEGQRFQEAQRAIELETAERQRLAAEQLEREAQLLREQEEAQWRQQEEARQVEAQQEEEEQWRQAIAQQEAAEAARLEQEAAKQREQEELERQEREAVSRAIEAAAEQERASWEQEAAPRNESEPTAAAADEPIGAQTDEPTREAVFSPYVTEADVPEPDAQAIEAEEPQSAAGQPVTSFNEQTAEADAPRKEMKVAVSSKSVQEQLEPAAAGGIGFRSLLHSSQREQEARAAAELSAKRAAEEAKKSNGDEIEWKRLFLNRPAEGNEFKKMRIAIVQKEETLDSIAGRYQLQAREIALYNRLGDQNVSEGQVLYIP
ncbi:stage VI sporulation protein D [Paenibacillus phyllosphaerae]|uniref:Stage VI sporulation protein D n=1 Tax=Paenibacillus phyllosphaerae TaxID=274593 RepID=A0A7W5AW38_9BACL|nr:stage VI sporulation protein D [Paenibacillus phyllosphaerae]